MLSHVGGISTSNSADVVKNQRQINACQIQETILASKDLSGAAKAVLLAVLKYTGGGRHACTAAAATLGKTAGYSPVYVKKLLKRSEADAWIVVDRCGGKLQSRYRKIYMGARAGGSSNPYNTHGLTSPTVNKFEAHSIQSDTPIVFDRPEGGHSYSVSGANASCRSLHECECVCDDVVFDKALCVSLARHADYLPHNTWKLLRLSTDLEVMIQGDWRSLALAIAKNEIFRLNTPDAPPIVNPVGYLVRLAAEVRGMEPGPDVHRQLRLMLTDAQAEDLARQPHTFRDGLAAQWNDLEQSNASVDAIAVELEREILSESECLGLGRHEVNRRLRLLATFVQSKRPPRLTPFDPVPAERPQDGPGAIRRHG